MKKVIINGMVYYGIGDCAKYLGTNAAKIWELISNGELMTAPFWRLNSAKVYVYAPSLVDYKYKQDDPPCPKTTEEPRQGTLF